LGNDISQNIKNNNINQINSKDSLVQYLYNENKRNYYSNSKLEYRILIVDDEPYNL